MNGLWADFEAAEPLPLKEGRHVPRNQSVPRYCSLICAALKWGRWNGEGKNRMAIYKKPFSWRRSGPFLSLPSCFYSRRPGVTVRIPAVPSVLCICVWCSEWSAPNPDWARSSYPEGITNRWLLVPLIPYTVKQALLENSHSNMTILSRLELEGRLV